MPLNAFIVRPFEVKELFVSAGDRAAQLQARLAEGGPRGALLAVAPVGDSGHVKVRIDFDEIDRLLIRPALDKLRIHGETATAVVVAGNIREDMFNRLITADLVIADLSVHNPNVFYELGVRQAFRDKYTFLIRSDLSEYPFDLKTDRYFEYNLIELADRPDVVIRRLVDALRATISSYEADSPIFKLLPQLEAEDRARFIAVPEEFREEVERARRYRKREHLSLMAVECEGYLWEVEGLRVVGRAQFESNFIDGARCTWESIVGRYPDDIEANTVLSTIYQRLGDLTRSEQALARVARSRSMSPNRLSQLRALSGRNLKEAWVRQWQRAELADEQDRQKAALASPLLQRASDAYHEAFKADLNNAYAGLNALTLLVIQAELAMKLPEDWAKIQRRVDDATRQLANRKARIRQLIAALELAVESDRERLQQQGVTDPWFSLLEAAVMCIVSDQPEHVAQLYAEAKHFAPDNAEESMRRALEVYRELGIGGRDFEAKWEIGTIGSNVARAIRVLTGRTAAPARSAELQRILMFVGLRLDHTITAPDQDLLAAIGVKSAGGTVTPKPGFPASCVDAAREAIQQAVDAEIRLGGKIVFGMAAGANGGDLLFHQVCRARNIPTRLCLALPKPQYIGRYVAPAGKQWVEEFSNTYRQVQSQATTPEQAPAGLANPVSVFTDTAELPRWLQGRPFYNVGRRNNLWMLQHAITAAYELGDNAEITLLALWNEDASEGGIGGISDVVQMAVQQGIKVHSIPVPHHRAASLAEAANSTPADTSLPRPEAPRAEAEHGAPRKGQAEKV